MISGDWSSDVCSSDLVATTSFIPFEVYELTRRFTPIRLGALVVNVAIVGYLAVRRWHARRGHGPVAGLIVLAVLGVGLTSCGHECPALPCALPIAITISVTKAAAGGPVEGATVQVTGAATTSMPCPALCRVPGTAGTYNLDVTAPGFAPVRRTVVVEGTTPPCGCPTVVSQSVTIVLASASSSLRDW